MQKIHELLLDPSFQEIGFTRLLIALAAGSILGLEREFQRKAAGIRTIALICVSSALFTILSVEIGGAATGDRIASNILTGVGFIGAGVIFRGGFTIDGITTATVIWISAAIGMAIGVGEYRLAWAAVGISLLVLWGLTFVEKFIMKERERKYYAIKYREDSISTAELETMFTSNRLLVKALSTTKTRENQMVVLEGKYELTGPITRLTALNELLLKNEHILQFEVELTK
ncbi:MgtC/SapB family protein [Chitinophaga niabensis]|uniref:Putative Mg2+ transporter-C (MgtC) family protein n=1 Tax=Chitinophaga niabensis TaxID=536979 RepID=A0A1N6E6U7_9BACT|nr:MgtC/SapB family protein [Chitinophaga niabensis]SIN78726.1 putative Mg2+ transporter-C (MgtC) family protein [Chitinophaga niabensis]